MDVKAHQRFIQVERKNERQKFKGNFKPKAPKGWSHQDTLTNLIGKEIDICVEGQVFFGTLLNADQFTIQIDAANPDGIKNVYCVFKSALTWFCEHQKQPAKTETDKVAA